MRRGSLGALAAAASMFIAGCANDAPGDLTSAAAKTLRPAVQNVRQAAASGSYADLRSAVQQLIQLVRQEESSGGVTAQRANAIEDAANVLLQDARPAPSPTLSSESPSPTVTIESPTPTPTVESPTPTSTSPTASASTTPILTVSAAAHSPRQQPTPTPTNSTR